MLRRLMVMPEMLWMFWLPVATGFLFLAYLEWSHFTWGVGEGIEDARRRARARGEEATLAAQGNAAARARLEALLESALAFPLLLWMAVGFAHALTEGDSFLRNAAQFPRGAILFLAIAPITAYGACSWTVREILDARDRSADRGDRA